MRLSGLTLRDLIHAQRPSRKVSSLMGMDPQRQSRILPALAGKIGCRPCPYSGLWTEHEPDRHKTSIKLR